MQRLIGSPVLAARRNGRCRTSRIATVWHDTAGGTLQSRGLALAEQAGHWRLERLSPNGAAVWPPATAAPILAEAASPGPLVEPILDPLTDKLVPVAAFTGTRRSFPLMFGNEAASLDVLEGALRGVAQEKPAGRVQVSGAPAGLTSFAAELAAETGLTVPRAGLAADAVAVAWGTTPAPRHIGAPDVPPGVTVADALRLIAGHLADVILYWAPLAPDGRAPEPVHQMRVAVRRLRAALSLFKRVSAGSALREVGQALKEPASYLGAARDWDVFLGGSGAAVRAAFPDEARIAGLLAAAARKRTASYTALRVYLESDAWRRLSLRLAMLPTVQPWLDPDDPEQAAVLAAPAETHAGGALARVHRHLQAAGADLQTLPPADLHAVRKQAKKLRYASEFFAPLFPNKRVKRFLEKLEDVQETFGTVNDGHVAASLMGQLGGDRAFATGVVQGYVAALSQKASSRAVKSWARYMQQETFWG